MTELPWRPIYELTDYYVANMVFTAPELIDEDHNPWGFGFGFYQDDQGFVAVRWNNEQDYWEDIIVTPTHFIILTPPEATEAYRTITRRERFLDHLVLWSIAVGCLATILYLVFGTSK